MTKSLFSSSWYRVADLKPRLRSHAQIHRQRFRGQLWYILQDHASGRYHRFSPGAHLIIAQMDGNRTVQEIWEFASSRLGDDLPTQDEVVQLLSQLHSADVLHSDVPPDVVELSQRSTKQRRRHLLQRIRNPLAVRIPLVDPDRFLSATLPLVRPLFGWLGLLLWLGVVGYALALAGLHWSELTENLTDRVLATENIFLLLIAYPVVKVLHELGHGYAVKMGGGEVHEMGIMFLVLMPVPYVEASSASAFHEKWRRAGVGAAGILVEMFQAAVALFVWLHVEPGLVRACAFNVMLISGVSTVLFNGNPLLRFDGYYVLADLIEIPNLGTRANKYIFYLVQRYLFGISELTSPVTAPGERGWLFCYGIASFFYRTFIMVVIVLFIATRFFVVGVLLAIWSSILIFVVPLAKGIWFLLASARLRRRRVRPLTVAGVALAAVASALLLVPVPYATLAEGVVWVPDNSRVHAETDGFVTTVLARPNEPVRRGDPLIVLENPLLMAEVRVQEAELRELEFRYRAMYLTDLVKAEIIREQIKHVRVKLDRNRKRTEKLILRSPADGKFVVPKAADLPRRFVRKGQVLAFVVDFTNPIVRVIVPQADIDLVRQRTRGIELRFIDRIGQPVRAVVKREVPAATDQLPSMALSTEGGGEISMDPTDPSRRKTLRTLFQFDLGLLSPAPVTTIGGRVFVRFDHGDEALAWRLYRNLRLLFLRQFNV